MPRRPCLGGCGELVEGRARCKPCARSYEALRGPQRAAYRDPAYKAMGKPHGRCWICGEPGADTWDHVVPLLVQPDLRRANHPGNLRPAHRGCNARKGSGHPA